MRQELPWMQAEFCEAVCLPVYRALGCLSQAFKEMEAAVKENMERWREVAGMEEDVDSVIVRNV